MCWRLCSASEEEFSLLSSLPDACRVDENSDEFQDVVKEFYDTIQEFHNKIKIVKVGLCHAVLQDLNSFFGYIYN